MVNQSENHPRVYLAGPEVFLACAAQIGEAKKALCRKYGFTGLFPLDGGIDTGDLSPREAGRLISAHNENLIRSCQLLIANITPFRGPSADAGTVYEIGFARGLGLAVLAYTNTTRLFIERTRTMLNLPAGSPGAERDALDMAIEDFGMVDNLMIEGGIQAGGGRLVARQVPAGEIFLDLAGFEQCLQQAGEIFQDP